MRFVFLAGILIAGVYLTSSSFKPSFNGTTPGCSGGSCHSFKDGIVSASALANFQVEVTVTGVTSGKKVAGELVDAGGSVVDVIDATSSNPFVLTAPGSGVYRVNAGYKDPSRQWDSVSVTFSPSALGGPSGSVIPRGTELYDNHPNPFNNETMIRYYLPAVTYTTLKIYDLNGKLIRNLVNGIMESGMHTLRWDGRNNRGQLVPSGTYIYQLDNQGHTISKKLVLIK